MPLRLVDQSLVQLLLFENQTQPNSEKTFPTPLCYCFEQPDFVFLPSTALLRLPVPGVRQVDCRGPLAEEAEDRGKGSRKSYCGLLIDTIPDPDLSLRG